MKKIILLVIALMFVLPSIVLAENTEVDVTIPEYDVKVNGVKIETAQSQYPVLVYKGVTYFPMTSDYLSGVGLNLKFSNETGLEISKSGNLDQLVQRFLGAENELGSTVKAKIAPFPVKVNGKMIDNASEEYPVLSYKNVTYFPMTWRFAVTEFGWKTTWSNEKGFGITIEKEVIESERKKLSTTEIGKLTASVVQLRVTTTKGEEIQGSGFFYNDEGGIITNFHVVASPKSIVVIDDNGDVYDGEVIIKGYSIIADTLILDTTIDNETFLPLTDAHVATGNEIYVIGSPNGHMNTLSDGLISAVDYSTYQMTAAVSPGSSGGPLINEYGECIGVVVAKDDDAENIGFAIPARYVMNLKANLNNSLSDHVNAMKKKAVIETEALVYFGSVKNDKPNGFGEIASYGGKIIIGMIENGGLEGYAMIYMPDGTVFVGTFEEDTIVYGSKKHYGKEGILSYTGSFKDWKFDGKGEYFGLNDSYYKGEYVEGYKEGYGTYNDGDGNIYVGFFKKDQYHGQGQLKYANGATYIGGFENGLRSGYGKYVASNGDVKEGNWENNVFVE